MTNIQKWVGEKQGRGRNSLSSPREGLGGNGFLLGFEERELEARWKEKENMPLFRILRPFLAPFGGWVVLDIISTLEGLKNAQ